MDIESKLQPLCNIISSKVQNNANGVSRHEFNNKLHEWILLPPPIPNKIKTSSVAASFMSLTPTPSIDENVSNNNTILIQSHSLSMNTSIGCAVSPIGYDEEYDEKIALSLSPPST